MQDKDIIALIGIGSTLLVSIATLLYSIWSNNRSVFVNTVTTSRLRWIGSLRDEVAEYIAVNARIEKSKASPSAENTDELCMQRDTLLHQIVLHLNPNDGEDQEIRRLAEQVRTLTDSGAPSPQLVQELVNLRNAAAEYLKKEWNRVKEESGEKPDKNKNVNKATSDS